MNTQPVFPKSDISGLLKLPELSADAIVANCNVKICMKGPDDADGRPLHTDLADVVLSAQTGHGVFTSCLSHTSIEIVERLARLQAVEKRELESRGRRFLPQQALKKALREERILAGLKPQLFRVGWYDFVLARTAKEAVAILCEQNGYQPNAYFYDKVTAWGDGPDLYELVGALTVEHLDLLDDARERYMVLINITSGTVPEDVARSDRAKFPNFIKKDKRSRMPLFSNDDLAELAVYVTGLPDVVCEAWAHVGLHEFRR